MSSDANSGVWEEEHVSRMLDLGGVDDAESADAQQAGSARSGPPGGPGLRPPPSAATTTASTSRSSADNPIDDWSGGERWSDITDPFEEFHTKGELELMEEDIIQAAAVESQGAQGAQGAQGPPRPGSRRTQFLRNVSLFSAAHQLAVLEVREEQGVSLLERSTSLTAEPLDEQGLPTGRSLSLPGPDASLDGDRPGRTTRSCSLATAEPPRKPSRDAHGRRLTQTRASRRRSSVAASSRTPSSRGSRGSKTSRASRDSKAGSKDSKASRDSRKASKDSRKASRDSRRVSRDSRRGSRVSRTSRVSGSRKPSTIVAAQATPRPSLARSTSKGGSPGGVRSPRSPHSLRSDASDVDVPPTLKKGPPDIDADVDPALAALLHELWAEPAVEPTKRKPGKKDKDKEWDWPDTLSGLWRMLDSYDEFVCSPAGFHAFRQDRPHWLDQEPIPWAIREAAREKCNRWLQKCPTPPAVRAMEMRMGRRDTIDSMGRRRSAIEPQPPAGPAGTGSPGGPGAPPARSLTSTPALADPVSAITAVRKLKKFQRL